jgi:hypothetical protein
MFQETRREIREYVRTSKTGESHRYTRSRTIVVLKCDSCQSVFERSLGEMDPRRLSENHYHVCKNCDTKRFAQKRGVENRRLWNMPADSDIDISRL